jgi:hypothetical protein
VCVLMVSTGKAQTQTAESTSSSRVQQDREVDECR